MLANNRWVRSSGTLQDKPISIQHREDWQLAFEAGDYHHCVQIAWSTASADDSTGFASMAEQMDILAFGEMLQKAIEPNENALIVMVLAHSGVNQWVIYLRDLEQFKQDLDNIDTALTFPIEVVADEDANWSTFHQIYAMIAQPA
ncbi:MAG: DUF695 domain-containing protein [Venatoribacter sp.]